jgi:hypothetical protein
MVKVKVSNDKSLKEAKEKLSGAAEFRKTKYGIVAAKTACVKRKKDRNKN